MRYQEAVERDLFSPLGMTSASHHGRPDQFQELGAAAQCGRRPLELNDDYYCVPPRRSTATSDMAMWMLAQMGEMPQVLSPQLLETIHQGRVKTPASGRGCASSWSGWGPPNMAMAGGYDMRSPHRGSPRRSEWLPLADPVRSSVEERGGGAVEQQYIAAGRAGSSEVMDMLYGLDFRDWMELDRGGPRAPEPNEVARDETVAAAANPDSSAAPIHGIRAALGANA
jgi:beta-lactamase class C